LVSVIVACIFVSAGSVAVLQFFLALDASPRAAAEATWVVKVSRWCAVTARRWHGWLGPRLRRTPDAEAGWGPETHRRPWFPSRRLAALGPVAAGNGRHRMNPADAAPALPRRNGAADHGNGTGPARSGVPARPLPAGRAFAGGRAAWVWTTRPDFYAEPDGADRPDLDPSPDYQPGGWHKCDPATRRGDLVLVYRTAPRKDLRYLVEAVSHAYPLDDDGGGGPSGGHGCDYRVLHKIDPAISLAELRLDPVTSSWPAVRSNFRRGEPVPPEVWDRLSTLIAQRDARAGRVLRRTAHEPVRHGPHIERELESRLFHEPQRLSRIGLDVEAVGRRIRHPHGGLLDMLFRDKTNGDYVVVALKPGRGACGAVTQLLEDVASVPDLYETPSQVRGVLIAADFDRRAERIMRGAGNLEFARLEDVGLAVQR